ncbi:hypothetical protein P9209_03930 [Prescottella defluvii]|nr:hypothetical protein P9209_03930 [Prescottella defluvii]
MRITERPSPPTGWKRRFFRMPITLYRWHLGALLGHRFVLVEHVGRRSGRTRQVVLEVDGSEADFREAGRNIHFVRLRPVHG